MLFSEMKKGQVLGVTFPQTAAPMYAGKTFGFRVERVSADKYGETLWVKNVKGPSFETHGFLNDAIGADWPNWKLIEPAVES